MDREHQAQSSCLQLCSRLLKVLPRELRDIVYEYLVTPDCVYVGSQYLSNSGAPCENNIDAHFWDERYVGKEMKIELAQTWYRTSLFYFWDRVENDRIIDEFMALDRWGYDIKSHEHISRVRFDVGDVRLLNRGVNGVPAPIFQDILDNFTSPLRKLREYRFPNSVAFLIRVHTYGALGSGYLRDETLQTVLQQLLFELSIWKASGHRFTVQWSEVNNVEFSSRKDAMCANAWSTKLINVSTENKTNAK